MTDGTGFDSRQRKEIFLFPKKFSPHLNIHPALFLVIARSFLPLEVKWLGHEADGLAPPSAKVKNAWSYTSTDPHAMPSWHNA